MKRISYLLIFAGIMIFFWSFIHGLILFYKTYFGLSHGIKYVLFSGFDILFIALLYVLILSYVLLAEYPSPNLTRKRIIFGLTLFFVIIGYGACNDYLSIRFIHFASGTTHYSVCFTQRKTGKGAFGDIYLLAREDIGCNTFTEEHKRLHAANLDNLVQRMNSDTNR
jgi:hypothetical protein